jgi:hypothetical protein
MKGKNEMREGIGGQNLKMLRPSTTSKKVSHHEVPHMCIFKDLPYQRNIENPANEF